MFGKIKEERDEKSKTKYRMKYLCEKIIFIPVKIFYLEYCVNTR